MREFFRGKEEMLELFMEDGFQVDDRHLVPAVLADIFIALIGRHIHFRAAMAKRESGEQVAHLFRRQLPASFAARKNRLAFAP